MPSAPNANSPYMESRLQSTFGVKAPGTPSSTGKPGVQAADVSFPAPPAPSSAPAGRPSATPTPAPIAPPAPSPAPAPVPTKSPAPGEMWPDSDQSRTPVLNGEMWPDTPLAPTPPPSPSVVPSVTALNEPQLSITPEGAQRYRELVVRGREALGPLPNILRSPGMPELPFEPGKQNYNPFTGRWGS